MHDLSLIRDLGIMWLAALIAGAISSRLKVPLIAGYLLAGLAVGPFGLQLISYPHNVESLAELGVALLLFALGVELTLREVVGSGRNVIIAGLLQVSLTALLASVLAGVTGIVTETGAAFVIGCICALSSTAVVTKLLVERGEVATAHGRLLIPILLIQDFTLVPVVALLPLFSNAGGDWLSAVALSLGKALLLVGLIVFGATFGVPRLLNAVARSNSRELFLLTVMTLCLAVALLSEGLGISLALGAFLAGIMVSERPFGHQVLADIIPLRDLFATLFFVSIGMMLDPSFIMGNLLQVCAFVGLLMLGKIAIAALCARMAVKSWWSALLVGIGLGQIGEFSFVVAMLSRQMNLIDQGLYNLFLAGAVVSLVVSPLLISFAPRLLVLFPWFRHEAAAAITQSEVHQGQVKSGHVVLCGFGRMGNHLGMILKRYDIPFVVVEVDANMIEELKEQEIPYIYGDALSHVVLAQAGIKNAACVVIALPDPIVTLNVINYARKENPAVKIIARAHRARQVEMLRTAGANAVVQPEFEAGLELTKLTLYVMKRSGEEIRSALKEIRQRGYNIFNPEMRRDQYIELPHEEYFGVWFLYNGEEAKTLSDLDIRRRTGATVLAVRRGGNLIPHPDGTVEIGSEDSLYIAGNDRQLTQFEKTFPVSRYCPAKEVIDETVDSLTVTGDELV